MLRINPDGTHPHRQPVLQHRHRRQPRHLGARPAQPVHLRLPAGHRPDVHQRRRPERPGRRSTTASPAPTTAGPTTEGPHRPTRGFRGPLFAYGTAAATGCAITGGAFYNPATSQFPAELRRRLLLRRLLRRLDPPARPRRRHRPRDFATGISLPVDLAVGPDGELYYLARGGAAAVYRICVRPVSAPSDHDPAGRARPSPPASRRPSPSPPPASPPLSYQWQRNGVDIAGRHRRQLHARLRRRRPTTAPSSAAVVTNTSGTATSNEATLTVTANQRAHRHITAPGAGTLYTAPARRSPTPAPAPTPRTAPCRPAPSPGGSTSTTTPTPTRSSADHRREPAARSPSRTTRRDRHQRLVPHPPDGPRLGRPHSHHLPRRPPAQSYDSPRL